MNAHTKGTCYLLQFERPYRHARHYLGWTVDLAARLDEHLAGTGGRLLEVITAEGIGFSCVRTWPNTTLADERRLKNRHRPKLCPVCNPLGAKGVSRCQT
ncbi:MAG: endonuclease [Acidobacteria bacterium Pan2503]|uniref:Endonuclease n=1 Tax=Candidatus Acidiferrum panamense TaxID=2741543 RepID=A0A7V8SWN7_9BACT|nr:endonuclease [Candidatus Acidoferrum panamensis]